jgi:hypothetical protein
MPDTDAAAAPAGSAAPPLYAMESNEVDCTITRTDGTREEGTARIVHQPGAVLPARIDHTCDATCGRCPR